MEIVYKEGGMLYQVKERQERARASSPTKGRQETLFGK
jgi:hypothetical protein